MLSSDSNCYHCTVFEVRAFSNNAVLYILNIDDEFLLKLALNPVYDVKYNNLIIVTIALVRWSVTELLHLLFLYIQPII
jgi:hypothetical protein